MDFPGGASQTFSYDALLRLEQMTSGASGPNAAYTYDNVSNILTKSTDHGSYTYGYDDVSRLTSADNPTLPDDAFTYDGVGNRATASNANGVIVHNANNELTVYGELEYDYDANGNLIQKRLGSAAVNYVYDAANRLVQVEDDVTQVVIAEYGYDPFGRRLWKEVNGTRTYFLYADEGLVAEYDQFGTEIRSYGWQPDSTWGTHPLWLKQNGEYYWYQNDHLGTPQQLIDSTGTIVWSAHYTAFGEARVQVETVENNLRFPGQYFDAETGLHYNFHRYYDPKIGRYTKVDPIGLAGGDVNLYGYVGNAPINGGDPMGLAEPISIAVGFCTAQPQICAAIAAGVTYGACRLVGGCQPLPIGEPLWLPSFSPPVVPPLDPSPYPRTIPPSLLFPRIPSMREMCDPGDDYFPPPETWKEVIEVPTPSFPEFSEPDCTFMCDLCKHYLTKKVGFSNAAKATVACFECSRCILGLWEE